MNDLYDQAVAVVIRDRKASTSYIQRRLSIGYNRAASLIERMEKEGVVGTANHAGKREILVSETPPEAAPLQRWAPRRSRRDPQSYWLLAIDVDVASACGEVTCAGSLIASPPPLPAGGALLPTAWMETESNFRP